jgi:hypothetical protein
MGAHAVYGPNGRPPGFYLLKQTVGDPGGSVTGV